MGHSSIQVTVDLYGHLIPGVNTQTVDRLDTSVLQHDSAAPAPPAETFARPVSSDQLIAQEVMTGRVGGGWMTGFEYPTHGFCKPLNFLETALQHFRESVAIVAKSVAAVHHGQVRGT
jgi:hypothetical protein